MKHISIIKIDASIAKLVSYSVYNIGSNIEPPHNKFEV